MPLQVSAPRVRVGEAQWLRTRARIHLPSILTTFIRPDDPLLIDTAAFTQSKWLATKTMSSLFALPSIGGARTWATQLPSDSCSNEERRAFGLTLTRITVPTIDFCDIGASKRAEMTSRRGARVARATTTQVRCARRRGAPRPALRSLAVGSSPGIQGRPRRCSI